MNDQDKQLIRDVNTSLARTGQLSATAKELNWNVSSLFMRLRSLGYKVEKTAQLVPIHPADEGNGDFQKQTEQPNHPR